MSPITGLLPGRPAESLRPRLRRDRHDPAGRTSQIHRNPRTTFPRCVLEHRSELRLERCGLGSETSPVAILLVSVPGVEEIVCDLEAVVAELLLVAHALAVGGEVSEQVGPAELPPAG